MESWLWILFALVVGGMMVLDLGILNRRAHDVTIKESLAWTGTWILIALSFDALVWWKLGTERAIEFTTCYLTEYALSVDNLFVFLVIFAFFAVPKEAQHRVLFWGILGAMIMRGIFLVAGVALIQQFEWTVWILGGILVLTGAKLMFQGDVEVQPAKNPMLRIARRLLPVTDSYSGAAFFVRRDGHRLATPLFLALLVVETTDVLFAVDSVPAALGITQDTFVLYTSNVFAILGLRSLFFAVSGLLKFLYYLKIGLSLILVFVGLKMLAEHWYKMPVGLSLLVVAGILALAIVASLLRSALVKEGATKGGRG